MQNRSMFPYRRQGPKKRNKNNHARKMHGPQKGLPNSARDLLPILQPATKALAQVLAGRTNASGQLGHAQTVLAHAERLIGERAHNRLNPAEREEFFEQLARLKLTIADADAEAEVVAAEEQEPKRQAPPVDQERLRALALTLTTPDPAAAPANGHGATQGAAPSGPWEEPAPDPRSAVTDDADEADARDRPPADAGAGTGAEAAPVSQANARSGRLQLSRSAGEQAVGAIGGDYGPLVPRVRRARARRMALAEGSRPDMPEPNMSEPNMSEDAAAPQPSADAAAEAEAARASAAPAAGPAAGPADPDLERAGAPRRVRRSKHKGLPEGWVIDDEGFVVPGPR
jgi:hypothetical protein